MSGPFVEQLVRSGLALAVACLAGVAVVAMAPRRLHRSLLPATPVLGVLAIVVVAHWLTIVLPYRISAWIVTAAAVLGAAVVTAVPRWRPAVDRRTVLVGVLLVAAALPAVAILNSPNREADADGIRFTSGNHDQFYFTAVDDWLVDHTNLTEPRIGASNRSPDGPASTPVWQYQPFKRWGEASVQALPTSLLGGTTSEHWYVLTSMWLLLVPGAVFLLASGLGADDRAATVGGVLAGLLVCGGGVLTLAVLNQNGPFVLGVPLVLAAAGTIALAFSAERFDLRAVAVASVAVAGWLGTYFELAVVAAPMFLVVALLCRRMDWAGAARTLGGVVVGTVVVGALPVLQTLRGLSYLGGAAPPWPSYFAGDTASEVVGKLVGERSLWNWPIPAPTAAGPATAVLAVCWIAALVASLWWRPTRWLVPAVGGVTLAYWWTQSRGDTNYVANRMVSTGLVVVGLLVVVGAAATVVGIRAPSRRWVWPTAATLAVVGASVALATSAEQVHQTVKWATPNRVVTAADRQAVDWLDDLGGPDGDRAAIATPDFAHQLILMDLTRHLPDVGWSVLTPDYAGRWGFSSATAPRYVLTDVDAMVVGAPTLVHSNERWALYRLDGAAAVVASPGGMTDDPGPDGTRHWTGRAGTAAVAASASCRGFDVVLRSAGTEEQDLTVSSGESVQPSTPARAVVAGPSPVPVPVATPADGTAGIRLAPKNPKHVLDLLSSVSSACVTRGAP